MKTEYRQKLPHIQPIGAGFFVTFSLFGIVPKKKLDTLKEKYILRLNKATEIIDDLCKNPVTRYLNGVANLFVITFRKATSFFSIPELNFLYKRF
jgi:hypothetical protein